MCQSKSALNASVGSCPGNVNDTYTHKWGFAIIFPIKPAGCVYVRSSEWLLCVRLLCWLQIKLFYWKMYICSARSLHNDLRACASKQQLCKKICQHMQQRRFKSRCCNTVTIRFAGVQLGTLPVKLHHKIQLQDYWWWWTFNIHLKYFYFAYSPPLNLLARDIHIYLGELLNLTKLWKWRLPTVIGFQKSI